VVRAGHITRRSHPGGKFHDRTTLTVRWMGRTHSVDD
jgi:hypothetical protein